MARIDWKGLIGTVAPTIATALGGPLAGMATSAISKAVLGKENATQDEIAVTLEKSNNPDILLKIKEAEQAFATKMKELDIDVARIDAEDRASARQREIALRDWMPKVLALLYTVGYFAVLILIWKFPLKEVESKDLINTLFGVLSAAQMAIITYYFGSSSGSARKSETIEQVLRKG